MYRIITFFLFRICVLSALSAQEMIFVKAQPGDATPRLQTAIEQAHRLKGKKVVIQLEQGDYHLYRKSSSKQVYFISNTASEEENPDPTKHIGFWIKDMTNLIIDGGGAHLITHGEMTSFVIDRSENITLRNFTLKAADPSVTEMTVIDTTACTATFQVHPQDRYEIAGNQIKWKGEGWNFTGGIAQTFNPLTNVTNRCNLPTEHTISLSDKGHHQIHVIYDRKISFYPGEVFQMRDAIRDEACGFIHLSKNITLEHLNLHFLGNFGIVGQYSENLNYKYLNCEPEYGNGRTCAGFADFVQMSGCKGIIRITNSRFEGAQDDPINVHGTHLKVIAYEPDNKIVVRFKHPQSYGFEAFFPGDEIEFTEIHSLQCLQKASVCKVEQINNYDFRLTLNHPVPSAIQKEEVVIENVTWTPEVEIRKNYFARTPTRGILITTRRKVVIEKNIFYRTPMSAIAISNDARSWYESGPVHDVTIRNNQFIECGSPVISIAPENDRPNRSVHKGIRIENNRFELKDKQAIYARWTDHIHISGNYFNGMFPNSKQEYILLEHCTHVENLQSKYPAK